MPNSEAQVAQADQGDQGGVFQILYGQIPEAGHHLWDGLGQADAPQGLALCKVQGLGRFQLGVWHGLDGTAHHFGTVSANVQAQGQGAGHDRVQTPVQTHGLAQNGQGKVQPEQLYQ
uniref:Uncharacterized protein n=1 Tax=Panagrolaimus superbus TaxID=310955 RepID=A0A914YQD5_9BILA